MRCSAFDLLKPLALAGALLIAPATALLAEDDVAQRLNPEVRETVARAERAAEVARTTYWAPLWRESSRVSVSGSEAVRCMFDAPAP